MAIFNSYVSLPEGIPEGNSQREKPSSCPRPKERGVPAHGPHPMPSRAGDEVKSCLGTV